MQTIECSVDRQALVTTTGATIVVYSIDCEQNGDTSKHWVCTGPTASQSICHGDDNHGADIYEE